MRRATCWLLCATALSACKERAGQRVSDQPVLQPLPPDTPALPSTTDSGRSAHPSDTASRTSVRHVSDTAYYPAVSSLWPPAPRASQIDSMLAHDPGAVPNCGGSVTPPVTAESIGPFHLGASLSQLRRRCPRLLYGWYYVSDGYAEPAIAVRLSGTVVRAFLTSPQTTGTVDRVEVEGREARTAEGLGVGSTLDALRRRYGEPGASESDCDLRVWFASRPGLSFRVVYPPAERRECGALSEEPLPPDLRVVAMILVPR